MKQLKIIILIFLAALLGVLLWVGFHTAERTQPPDRVWV